MLENSPRAVPVRTSEQVDVHEETLEKLIDRAARRGVQAEVYFVQLGETPIEFENNRLKTLRTQATTGLALRVIDEGRLGFASSTDLARTDRLLDAAIETAKIGDPAEFDFAGEALDPVAVQYTPPSTAHFVDLGTKLIDQVRTYHPDILVNVDFTVRRSEVALATTAGARSRRHRLTISAALSGNLVRGEDLLEVYSHDIAREGEPDYASLLAEVLRKLRLAERPARVSGGPQTVLFTPRSAAATLGGLFRTVLSGQAISQKTSPLSDKVGQALFDSTLTLYEDPSTGIAAVPFDDEGTPTTAKQFIAEGTVQAFYWDRTWAARSGTQPGGNGFRSGLSRPQPSVVNLCMAAGQTPYGELLRSIENGVLVEQVLGAGQSNMLAGEFSVNLDLGYKVENGEIVGRIKNTMVAGNLFEAFKGDLATLSREREWVFGAALMPSIRFERMGVATRD